MSASLPASDPDLTSGPGPAADPHDPDQLLARYRASRTQAALYALRRGLVDINNAAGGGEDEPAAE